MIPFDFEAFEKALAEKVAAHPDLGIPLAAANFLTIAISIAGLWLLYRALTRRGETPPPPGPPLPTGWSVTEAVLVLLLMLPLGMIAILLARHFRLEGFIEGTLLPSLAVSLAVAALALLVAARHGQGARALGFARGAEGAGSPLATGGRYLVMAFPLYNGASLLSKVAFDALHIPRSPNPAAAALLTTGSPLDLALIAVFAVTAAPLVEELLFRGFFFAALRKKIGRKAAIVVSALAFALVHPAGDMLAIVLLGAALALAYDRAGSLYASITAHALNNAWGIAMLMLERTIYRA